jgi:hypothetical protein
MFNEGEDSATILMFSHGSKDGNLTWEEDLSSKIFLGPNLIL